MAIYGSEMAVGMEFHVILLYSMSSAAGIFGFTGTETFAHWDIDIGNGNS